MKKQQGEILNNVNEINDNANLNKEEVINKETEVDKYIEQEKIWLNEDLMPIGGIAGIYNTGYTFFDIDLDGEKELAVQLGGGTMHNCTTLFYEYEEGVINQKNIFEETYSLSVNELVLLNDGGEDFFVNKYNLKISPTQYRICYDKIYKDNEGMKTENLFSIEENYDENNNVKFVYYIKNEEVDIDKFNNEFGLFFENVEEKSLVNDFIESENFLKMTKDEKKNALENSYNVR